MEGGGVSQLQFSKRRRRREKSEKGLFIERGRRKKSYKEEERRRGTLEKGCSLALSKENGELMKKGDRSGHVFSNKGQKKRWGPRQWGGGSNEILSVKEGKAWSSPKSVRFPGGRSLSGT